MVAAHKNFCFLLALARRSGAAPPRSTRRASNAEVVRGPYYFYDHVPKTGGNSLYRDLKAELGFKACFGPGLKSDTFLGRHTFWNVTREYAAARVRKLGCNFASAEASYARKAAVFPEPPRVLLLVREPTPHVVSLFAHCQSKERSGRANRKGTIDEWIGHWHAAQHGESEDARFRALARAHGMCHYVPVDFQTRMLGEAAFRAKLHKKQDAQGREFVNAKSTQLAFARERRTTPECVARATDILDRAWHVAPLESYAASLCVLRLRLRRPDPSCDCARPSSKHLGTHATHQTHPAHYLPSAATRVLIANLTANDHALWRKAQLRFARDAEELARTAC